MIRILALHSLAMLAVLLPGSDRAFADEPVHFSWTEAADGGWSDTTKWTDELASGSAPLAGGLDAYELGFAADGVFTVTQDLNPGFKLNRLVFGGSAVTINGGSLQFVTSGASLPAISQSGVAGVTIATPMSLASDLTFSGTGTATISGAISGNGGLTMAGSGILSLTGANTYRGGTTVESGTLQLSLPNTGNDKSVVTIAAGAALDLGFTGSDTVGALVLDGAAQADGIYDASNSGGLITGDGSLLVVTPVPSSNASLASLGVAGAGLSPAFNPLTGNYSAAVGNAVSSITVTPTVAGEGATVTVNGTAVASGTASNPVALSVGPNLVTTLVRAQDNVTTRIYTVNVNRASAAVVATSPAVVIDASRATLSGTVNPNGLSTVYFEYGTTPEFGSRTPDRDVSGNTSRAFAASISGLAGATTYHYRAVLSNAAGTIQGNTLQFTTVPNPPVAATGAPADVTASTATFVGAVNPNGVNALAYFEYGLTTAYGQSTPVQNVAPGFTTVSVRAPDIPLIANGAYHFRLVASNSAGTAFGNDVLFTVQTGAGGGTGVPTAAPDVVTGEAIGTGTETAVLQGSANPNGGTSLVRFEYGLTASYGKATALQGVGNGDTPAEVAIPVQGLLPGTTYHFRLTGSNSLGNSLGDDATFTTAAPPPTAVTGDSTVLTTTSVRIAGSVRARGAEVEAWIDFGTDGISFNSVQATPGTVTGDQNTPVSAELTNLAQGVTYHYRVRALGDNGEGSGETRTFDVSSLSGLIQQYPPGVPLSERQGSVGVTLDPPDGGSGWRFAGEQFWRESGVPAEGLTAGDRVIEYRPVPGFVQPPNEAVAVASSPVPLALTRTYTPTAEPGNATLVVTLKPQDLTEEIAPARWRFFGEGEDDWRLSGDPVSGLVSGGYVIECKPVDGRSTPAPVTATVEDGLTTGITITYYIADVPVGSPPVMVGFDSVSSDTSLPNAFVGQIRGDAGSGTGFVVRPRVVATVGHAVFDDGTLAVTTGLQWLFQRDRSVHDPVPRTPRGHYLMTGYAAQRIADDSPGVSSPQSQNLDVATMFFLQDIGRGGYSGYLASDTVTNEFLVSDSLKTLVGYPVDGIPEADLDRMHATPPANAVFTKSFDRTYTTPDIRASGGASGGPLCVLAENGAYYPAAIYLGGTGQTVVRAIDSDVVALIAFADASSVDGVGVNGGSQSESISEPYEDETLGALKVVIEPASARAAGAGWRTNNLSAYLPSGQQLDSLEPGDFTISFPVLEGFVPPAPQPATVEAGFLKTITFSYEPVVAAPLITSSGVAGGIRGDLFSYQITADNSPALFFVAGTLPDGITFDGGTGLISGTLNAAGVFTVDIGASNTGGAASRKLVITSLPALEPQAATRPYLEAMTYDLVSSESGGGVSWTATGLPAGLVLAPATGRITGVPVTPGVYEIPISVAKLGAVAHSALTLTITGIPPEITLQPVASRGIQYGTVTTLVIAATGLPEPEIQWYEGPSGNTDAPVPGATSAVFNTPPLTSAASFWARASSISGIADSTASEITILPSSNANLSGLFTSDGTVSPGFNANVAAYTLIVPNDVSAILLTPVVEVSQSTVRVEGVLVPFDGASEPIELDVGSNLVPVDVTSGLGTVTKRYTLTVVRAQPPAVATGIADGLTDSTATLRGTATPNGPGTVFFQYGTTASYGSATPGQEVSGSSLIPVAASIAGLSPEITYHYRIGFTSGAGTIFGNDMTFETSTAPPLVATGQAIDVYEGSVKLIGAVDPNGTPTSVHFEYAMIDEVAGETMTTPVQLVPGGGSVVDIEYLLEGLVPGTLYSYRLVGESAAGTAFGEIVHFIVGEANAGTGTPEAAPQATTLEALDVSAAGALLQGSANPSGGTTFVQFEYGPSESYGSISPARGIGSGTDPATVIREVSGLLPGITYHYRLVAFNSAGTSYGEDRTFSTGFLSPLASTGNANPVSSSSVRVTGSVRARGAAADAFFEYGTDGVSFPTRMPADGGTVTGDAEMPVGVMLVALQPGVTYHYRAIATRPGDPSSSSAGEVKTFRSDGLAGLLQSFPRQIDDAERQGTLQVDLIPAGMGAWRFAGEIHWRASGSVVTGLATGDREIEYLTVGGYLQPGREPVGIISGAPPLVLTREYFVSATSGNSGLQVLLEPQARTGAGTPLSYRLQWRLFGYDDLPWRESGETLAGLMPGSYLVEFKPSLDLDAPPPSTVVIAANEARLATFAYNSDLDSPTGTLRDLPFNSIFTRSDQPYGYVGQIRNDAGSHSGFVVKPRVVATTAQALFDEITLSQIPGVQWLFQQHREEHEPKPQTPRGFYVFDGYAAQRLADNTPGTPSLAAQEMNAAAMYFLEDAGRGGFSGFLATDESVQPLANPDTLKTLVGYPVRGGGSTLGHGKMRASRILSSAYVPVSPSVFGTSEIMGLNGMLGGPLCIQFENGNYFPAGIYLGGSNVQNLVRAIDGGVIDLFNRAELTANTGDNNTSGGISQTSYTAVSSTATKGALTVILEPAEARAAGALWKLGGDSGFLTSGTRKNNLTPGDYIVQFKPVAGFQVPVQQTVSVLANNITTVTLTYLPALSQLSNWRVENFGSTSNSGNAADGQDADGDGSLNLDEFSAGTDPNDPTDLFKVLDYEFGESQFSIVVPGRTARTYTLQRLADLEAGTWESVQVIGPLTADGDLELTDPAAIMTQGFYRVTVEATAP